MSAHFPFMRNWHPYMYWIVGL